MSIRIRALSTKPLGDVTPEELRAGIAERLPITAPLYGEDDHEATLPRLVVSGEAGRFQIAYTDGRVIALERRIESARAREEVSKLVAALEGSDEDGVEDVRELLSRVVESATFELDTSDCEGIGWPVAIAAAASLAARGEGIVQADGEGYMMPRGQKIEHVLDGD